MINEAENVESIDRDPLSPRSAAVHARAMGSPLAMGAARHLAGSQGPEGSSRVAPALPPGRALPGSTTGEDSGIQRAVNIFRSFMPFVQRLLPLLDGNIATAIANLAAPRHQAPPRLVRLAARFHSVGERRRVSSLSRLAPAGKSSRVSWY